MRRLLISLLIGLLIGLAAGLTLGWVIMPVQYVDSPMRDLESRFRDDYTVMVAASFLVERSAGDLAAIEAASLRLEPLGVGNVFTHVRDVTERYISQRGAGRESDIRSLVELSCAMGYCTEPMQIFRLPLPSPTPGP